MHEKRFTDTVKRLKGQQKTRLVKDIWRLKGMTKFEQLGGLKAKKLAELQQTEKVWQR